MEVPAPCSAFIGRRRAPGKGFGKVAPQASFRLGSPQAGNWQPVLKEHKSGFLIMHSVDAIGEIPRCFRHGDRLVLHKIILSDSSAIFNPPPASKGKPPRTHDKNHSVPSPLAFSLQPSPKNTPTAAKPPFRPNYFHFCKCVKSVPTPPNLRNHNALAGVQTPFFDQKIVRTVRRRLFQNRATIAPR